MGALFPDRKLQMADMTTLSCWCVCGGINELLCTCAWLRNARAQDEMLREAVEAHGARNWKAIAKRLDGRTDVQCLHRWQKVLRPGLVKGPWTPEVRA